MWVGQLISGDAIVSWISDNNGPGIWNRELMTIQLRDYKIHMEYQYLKILMRHPTPFQRLIYIISTTSQHFRNNVIDYTYFLWVDSILYWAHSFPVAPWHSRQFASSTAIGTRPSYIAWVSVSLRVGLSRYWELQWVAMPVHQLLTIVPLCLNQETQKLI